MNCEYSMKGEAIMKRTFKEFLEKILDLFEHDAPIEMSIKVLRTDKEKE